MQLNIIRLNDPGRVLGYTDIISVVYSSEDKSRADQWSHTSDDLQSESDEKLIPESIGGTMFIHNVSKIR